MTTRDDDPKNLQERQSPEPDQRLRNPADTREKREVCRKRVDRDAPSR